MITAITTLEKEHKEIMFNAEDGVLSIGEYDFLNAETITLNGEWNLYNDVFFEQSSIDYKKLSDKELIEFPIKDIRNYEFNQVYQLSFNLSVSEDVFPYLALSIPFANDDIEVYLNGKKLSNFDYLVSGTSSGKSSAIFDVYSAYKKNSEFQELIISVNNHSDVSALYNRPITIAPIQNIVAEEKSSSMLDTLTVGMIFIVTLVSIIFIITMPKLSVLTGINLYDIGLMLHIVFSFSNTPQAVYSQMFGNASTDLLFRRLDLFFFALTGFVGNLLSDTLFDKHKKAHKIFRDAPNIAFIFFAILFFIDPGYLNTFTIFCYISILFFTLAGLFVKLKICLNDNELTNYKKFHLVKTLYLGSIIFMDLLTLNSNNRLDYYFVLLYFVFFIMHLFTRVYEYKLTFLEIDILNRDLEKTVEERTSELTKANEDLIELSTKDALTKCYNRLYFERYAETVFERYNSSDNDLSSLHLSIFDLDNFKKINDTFGHQVGDDQLVETAQTVRELIPENVTFARIGGEEFTLLFEDFSDDDVLTILENVRKGIEKLAQRHDRTTSSFGVCSATLFKERKKLFACADECLYYSKENGKNQISYMFTEQRLTYCAN